jgi:dolichyl-phosphate beta-glucosyltransferase
MYLSIIIPCLNEEKRIEQTLYAINDFLKIKNYPSCEILVVDNGSDDKTKEIVLNLMQTVEGLRLIERHSHGKGYAVKEGMLSAVGDYRLFTDADNSTDISHLDKLLSFAEEGYDVVISSRKAEGAVILNPQPPHRVFLGNLFQLIVKTIIPLGIHDTQNGFKLFTREAAEKVFRHQTIFYWAFDVEILAIAQRVGLRIKEVPITWRDDDRSAMRLKGMIRMLIEVLAIRIRLWTHSYSKVQRNP